MDGMELLDSMVRRVMQLGWVFLERRDQTDFPDCLEEQGLKALKVNQAVLERWERRVPLESQVSPVMSVFLVIEVCRDPEEQLVPLVSQAPLELPVSEASRVPKVPVGNLAFLVRLEFVESLVTGVLLVLLVPKVARALLEQTVSQVTKENWVPLVLLAKKESQEKEENWVQKVPKDPMGQLELQGSQDTQGPWAIRGSRAFLASQANRGLLAKRPASNI